MAIAHLVTTTIASVILISSSSPGVLVASKEINKTHQCQKKFMNYSVNDADDDGRSCSGIVEIGVCAGYCRTAEIGYYEFPFKQHSHHSCVPSSVERRMLEVPCYGDGISKIVNFEYDEPIECNCSLCNTSTTLCEGLVKKSAPVRSKPPMDVIYELMPILSGNYRSRRRRSVPF